MLVVAGTPIGNVEDASPRLRRLLAEADVVAAEDTRRVRDLASRLGVTIQGRVVSCFEHNEGAKADELVDAVLAGGTVLLVSDAGMPTVSDPGFRVVERAVERGAPLTCAPGPSAVLTALALSGLPSDRFCFEGFVPRKAGERGRALDSLAQEQRTMVFFESPHRIVDTVEAMREAFGGDRRMAVCRELTKTHEEVLRGTAANVSAEIAARMEAGNPLRGEICLVVEGAPDSAMPSMDMLVAEAQQRVSAGERLKDVTADIAATTGINRRDLYNAVLRG
ncbi:MAG: 16S rRNA (cytidine(1402)-2'-O)-methyltransferase [Cellulomonadaceae bacterium]|jgi:16S rRNA (cytidine1402-2'-O)-methyltransferase|nr:16S rRNA (cytidine(1402)-2'-O)-methyltransferase [Cellulomonadaceae bacterium]